MRCSSSIDSEIYLMLSYIERFVAGVSTCKTFDCYLIKLGSLIYIIEDYFGKERAFAVFGKVLRCEEVRESLRPIAGSVHEVEWLVLNDPRHKHVRRYLDLVLANLEELSPIEKPIVRKPTSLEATEQYIPRVKWEKTSGEERVEPYVSTYPATSSTREPEYRSVRGIKRIAFIAIIALMILVVVFAFYTRLFTFDSALPMFSPSSRVASISVLEDIRETVYRGRLPSSPIEAITTLLDWVEENVKYGEVSGETISLCIDRACYESLSPRALLTNKTGVCMDISVFIATALLSVNVTPVYVIIFDAVNHAVAGIVVNNILFILDQRPPPIEFSDYVEHILGGYPGDVRVFELIRTANDVDYRVSELPKALLESYMEDSLPTTIAREIAAIVSNEKALFISETAKKTPQKIIFLNVTTGLDSLGKQSHIAKFYTPVFHKWWVNYYARLIAEEVELGHRYLWVEVVEDGVIAYLATFRLP